MDWKKIGKQLLYPPIWVLIILPIVSTAALIGVFLGGFTEHALGYAVYVLSFYCLSAVCIRVIPALPGITRQLRARVESSKSGNRYLQDPAFRIRVSLHISLVINLLYAAVNGLLLLLAGSAWFGVLAVYYGILAVMRFLLIRYKQEDNIAGQWKRVKICAIILLTVNFALSGAVLMILYQDRGFIYQGILIYVMAIYSFYVTIHGIVGLIRNRKQHSPVMLMSKVISLSAACISMLALETAMLAQFGAQMPKEGQRLMIALTGAAVSITVITMSIYMLLRASREREKEYHYGK